MSGYSHYDNKVDIDGRDAMDFYAHLASAAYYGDDNEAKEKYLNDELGEGHGWEIDGELSNIDRTIYKKKKKDSDGYNVIMSNRGTDLGNETKNRMRNAYADAAIFFGAEPRHKRFKEANSDFLKMREKYGTDSNYSVSGHSLGGSQSMFLNRRYGVENHALNPGASFSHLGKGVLSRAMCWANPNWGSCKAADNSTIYHTMGDPVSTASLAGRDTKQLTNSDGALIQKEVGKVARYNPHGLEHFYKKYQKKK